MKLNEAICAVPTDLPNSRASQRRGGASVSDEPRFQRGQDFLEGRLPRAALADSLRPGLV